MKESSLFPTSQMLDVLKNYASINSNIVIEAGDVVKTVSEAKNVLSSCKLDVTFPKSFGIYDLNEFLSTISFIDSPRLTFEDNFVMVSDGTGRTRIKYHYTSPEILTTPKKDIIMPASEVKFVLDRQTFSNVKRAASVLGHTEMTVSMTNGITTLSVVDNNDRTSNAFSTDVVGTSEAEEFRFVFNISNLKMIDGDYDVEISSKLISHFVNKESGIEYWIALEKTSAYGA